VVSVGVDLVVLPCFVTEVRVSVRPTLGKEGGIRVKRGIANKL